MTFGADAPNHPPQPPQPFTYHIGAEMKTHENDAHNLVDYLPPFLAIITHPSLTHHYSHAPTE